MVLAVSLRIVLRRLIYRVCLIPIGRRGRSLIEEFIHGVKSAACGRHRPNFVLERVAEACPGNIIGDFFMLL
jgi:hypothetical protein